MIIGSPTLFRVRVGFEWAYVVLDEQTGLMAINSSYGPFVHSWPPAYRSEPLDQFIAGLDMGYFMSKTRGPVAKGFDLDETVKTFHSWICENRIHNGLTKEQAREAWDALDDIVEGAPQTSDGFANIFTGDERLDCLGSEWYEGIRQSYTAECTWFWRTLWPAIVVEIMCKDGLESPLLGL